MIANNIFKAIADFCENVLFAPFNGIRSMDNWWVQNTASWIFVAIGFVGFFYWSGQLKKYRKDENE